MPGLFRVGAYGASAPFVPTQIAGIVAWYDAGKGITLNGSTVSAWADQSGTGDANKNATQATASSQPTYVSSDVSYNGQPTIDFATGGVINNLVLPTGTWATSLASQATIYFVGHTNTTNSYPIAIGANNASVFVVHRVGTVATTGLSLFNVDSLVADTAPKIYCMTCTSAGLCTAYVNNITTSSASATNALATINSIALGNYGPTGGNPWLGRIASAIVYNTPHNATQRSQVMNYLGAKYGITVSP